MIIKFIIIMIIIMIISPQRSKVGELRSPKNGRRAHPFQE